jgi:ribosomal protein L7/L12
MESMRSRQPLSRIRVDFVVREVAEDGSELPPDEEPRGIRMSEVVPVAHLSDLFDRFCRASTLLMVPAGRQAVSLQAVGTAKINVIKVIRELTGLGLKEAKEAVESPLGTPIMVAGSAEFARQAAEALIRAGASVELRSYSGAADSLPTVIAML